MPEQYLEIGKITNTHGVMGEVRVQPWADSPDFLCKFKTLYVDSSHWPIKVERARVHKNMVILKLEGVTDVPSALAMRNAILYIDRADVKLPEGSFFLADIMGLEARDAQTGAVLGKIASGLHVPLELLIENREEAPATLYRAVDVAGQRLYGGKVIRYPLFPFDTDSRSESCQMDIFISGVYEAADHVPGSHVYLTVLSGTVKVTCGGEVFRLESRDCLSLPGQAERQYVNVGNTTVRLLEWIVYRKNG